MHVWQLSFLLIGRLSPRVIQVNKPPTNYIVLRWNPMCQPTWQDRNWSQILPTGPPKRQGPAQTALQWSQWTVEFMFVVPYLHRYCQILPLIRWIREASCLVNCCSDIDLVYNVSGLAPALGRMIRLQELCHSCRQHSRSEFVFIHSRESLLFRHHQGEYSASRPVPILSILH